VSSNASSPRRRLDPEERARLIIDAAAELFRQRPYGQVSIDDIAEQAGVTRGLIGHYFDKKRNLYVEVVRSMIRAQRFPIADDDDGTSLEDKLSRGVREWLDWIEQFPDLYRDVLAAGGIGDTEIREISEKSREVGAKKILKLAGIKARGKKLQRLLGEARLITGQAETIVMQWLEYRRFTKDEVHERIVRTTIDGIEAMRDLA
jgi:AcrR family transcriptional regulator